MANKAVVGVAALGVGGYMISENIKDWQAKNEQRAREQEREDNWAAQERRLEESMRKQGKSPMSVGEDMVFQSMFQVGVYAQIEQNLYDLVLKIGIDTPLWRNYNLQQLNLPLISNDYDNEDVMLLAALALGDNDLVERITKIFTKQKLGIGLTKFSARQIRKVIEALQSVEEPRIDINIVGLIVGSGIYDDDFRSGGPSVAFVKEEYNIYDFEALCDVARKCGFYVLNESNFSTKIRGDKNTIQYSLCNRLKGDGQFMLTNFISSFEVSADVETNFTESYQTARPDFSQIKLTGKDSKYGTNVDPKTGKKYKQLKPNEEAITDLFAKKIAARMAKEAARRLWGWARIGFSLNEGISLEHIAVSLRISSNID